MVRESTWESKRPRFNSSSSAMCRGVIPRGQEFKCAKYAPPRSGHYSLFIFFLHIYLYLYIYFYLFSGGVQCSVFIHRFTFFFSPLSYLLKPLEPLGSIYKFVESRLSLATRFGAKCKKEVKVVTQVGFSETRDRPGSSG